MKGKIIDLFFYDYRLGYESGYGFIRSQEGVKVYFRSSVVEGSGFSGLTTDSEVEFELGVEPKTGSKGPSAKSVKVTKPNPDGTGPKVEDKKRKGKIPDDPVQKKPETTHITPVNFRDGDKLVYPSHTGPVMLTTKNPGATVSINSSERFSLHNNPAPDQSSRNVRIWTGTSESDGRLDVLITFFPSNLAVPQAKLVITCCGEAVNLTISTK